ncbi:NAD(P)-dependent oxidoreductase [Variovorax sp. RCC_210]|uniref:NAD(P)-dependent oxidoreductase n=1 Tax=Variovorax sp. RCC_210 TaxID=3239217 RepID=UPI00352630B9
MDTAFIGIGSMGAAMVPNLVAAGHRVAVWNRNPAPAEALEGVTLLDAPAAAFQHAVVLTMLADDAAVRGVIVDSGALRSARPGCVHVMMATISPALSGELAALHQEAGVAYVAAPVFGVPAVAAAGQLNIVAAGPEQALATVRPLLEAMSRRVWPLGEDPLRANVAKIAGNMMIAQAIQALSEAVALGESYGLRGADFIDIVTNTLFASPSYQRYGKRIATGDYEPGFKLTLGLKDVNLALDAGAARQVVLPAARIVQQRMHAAIAQGLGGKDWSAFGQA